MIIDFYKIQTACNKFEQIFRFLESCAKDDGVKVSKRTLFNWALEEYNKSEWKNEFPLPDAWSYEAFRDRIAKIQISKIPENS